MFYALTPVYKRVVWSANITDLHHVLYMISVNTFSTLTHLFLYSYAKFASKDNLCTPRRHHMKDMRPWNTGRHHMREAMGTLEDWTCGVERAVWSANITDLGDISQPLFYFYT
jgi:hypothetical protein